MSKVFSTHPMTDDRIAAAQKNIQRDPEGQAGIRGDHLRVQRREGALLAMHNRRKTDKKDDGRPTLRRSPGSTPGTVDSDDGTATKGDDEDRPTLKRRPNE